MSCWLADRPLDGRGRCLHPLRQGQAPCGPELRRLHDLCRGQACRRATAVPRRWLPGHGSRARGPRFL